MQNHFQKNNIRGKLPKNPLASPPLASKNTLWKYRPSRRSFDATENTLASVHLAWAQGADAVNPSTPVRR